MRKFPFPRIHGPDHDLYIRSMLFFYKANNRNLFLSDETLPKERETTRHTRSEDPSCSKYEIKKCKTSTYQQSFTVRSTRIWDALPRAVTNKFNSFCV